MSTKAAPAVDTTLPPFRWHTDYLLPNWSPRKGYSAFFNHQIDELRQAFGLQPASRGTDVGTDLWLPHELNHRLFYLNVRKLVWNCCSNSKKSPIIKLEMAIAVPANDANIALHGIDPDANLLYLRELVVFNGSIVFSPDYPMVRPTLYFDDKRTAAKGFEMAVHLNNNLWEDRRICTMNNRADWSAAQHTMVHAVLYHFHWMSSNLSKVRQKVNDRLVPLEY